MNHDLITELRDRVPELRLYAEQHGVVVQPWQFPAGLFRVHGTEWSNYVREIASDITRLANAEQRPAVQEFLARVVQQKISVLTTAAKRQLHSRARAPIQKISKHLLSHSAQQAQLDQQLQRDREALVCLERTLARQHAANTSAILNTIKNLQAKIKQQVQALNKLQQLPTWLSET